MTAVLEAESLYRFYHAGDDETLALQGVSMSVEAGEVVAVTGPSGSGKSTLLACLAGLDEPDGGVVRIAGERLSRRPEEERARLRAASHRDALPVRQPRRAPERRARTWASPSGSPAAPGGWPGRPRCSIGSASPTAGTRARRELSGGELARAGLAVALANEPAVLLADEPTGELDSVTAHQVLELLRERAGAARAWSS